MIPKRIHRDLPSDAYWIIGEKRRQLTVYLANDIPEDGPLEQHVVRQATRAWRRRHYPGPLVILPIAAGGIAWALKGLRRPTVAAGTAAVAGAAVALAAVSIAGPDEHPRAPTVVAAPPQHSRPAPGHGRPSVNPPAPDPSPDPSQPGEDAPVRTHPSTGPTHGGHGPGHGGPTHGTPPGDPTPPGQPPSDPPPDVPVDPPVSTASTCRLVEIHVGKLVRICL